MHAGTVRDHSDRSWLALACVTPARGKYRDRIATPAAMLGLVR